MVKIRLVTRETLKSFLDSRLDDGIILSALNLFMLGFLKNNDRFPTFAYFWCDGLLGVFFARLHGHKIAKLRGAAFLKLLLEYHQGEPICIFGSMTDDARSVLRGNNMAIAHEYPMPELNMEQIASMPIDIDTKCIFLTLPSPKQELVALSLAQRYPRSNFYCIGGALNMLAHPELDCPPLLQRLGLEFLFRLRSDTGRRIKRLLKSALDLLLNLGYLRHYRIDVVK